MARSTRRTPRRRKSIEAVEFEALLDPVGTPPQVVEALIAPSDPDPGPDPDPDPDPDPEPAAAPEHVAEVPPEGAPQHTTPSRFDAAGTDDDRLPAHSKRTRRHR